MPHIYTPSIQASNARRALTLEPATPSLPTANARPGQARPGQLPRRKQNKVRARGALGAADLRQEHSYHQTKH